MPGFEGLRILPSVTRRHPCIDGRASHALIIPLSINDFLFRRLAAELVPEV
jgi:hypothetical protein